MKYKLFLLCIAIASCKIMNSSLFDRQLSTKILKQQSSNRTLAISAYLGREKLIRKKLSPNFSKLDTLFLIERVAIPEQSVWATIWSSKRDKVIEYVNENDIFQDTTYNYPLCKEPLMPNVEKFDTNAIDKHLILGGYRTFITQVINGKKVKSFNFDDATSSFRQSIFERF